MTAVIAARKSLELRQSNNKISYADYIPIYGEKVARALGFNKLHKIKTTVGK